MCASGSWPSARNSRHLVGCTPTVNPPGIVCRLLAWAMGGGTVAGEWGWLENRGCWPFLVDWAKIRSRARDSKVGSQGELRPEPMRRCDTIF
jgi:hypothetical protein